MSADIRLLKQLYGSGLSLEQVCQQAGLKSPGSLLKRLRRNGVKIRSLSEACATHQAKLPKQIIIDMYNSGLSCKDIAGYFNCCGRTINKYLNVWDVKARSREDAAAMASGSFLNQHSRKLILKLKLEQGLNSRAIALRTGISRDVIKRFITKATRHKTKVW